MAQVDCAVVIFEGTMPTVEFTFRDNAGTLGDPASMLVRVMDPAGGVVDYTTPDDTITNPSPGVWRWTPPTAPSPGTWVVYGTGTAGIMASAETSFSVKASTVPAP